MAHIIVPDDPYHISRPGNQRRRVFFSEYHYRFWINLVAGFCWEAGAELANGKAIG